MFFFFFRDNDLLSIGGLCRLFVLVTAQLSVSGATCVTLPAGLVLWVLGFVRLLFSPPSFSLSFGYSCFFLFFSHHLGLIQF